jgi:iron complex outermembrane receptor protein
MKKLLITLLFIASTIAAQKLTLVGEVVSAKKEPLVGVNILVQGTTNGTATDNNGKFKLKVAKLPVTLVFSSIGYKKKLVLVEEERYLKITMEENVYSSEDVTVVGSRFRPRTAITSPIPIDNIKMADLESTAQTSFDKMMHYTVPSFNSTQQTISDATAHFDPADLRGLGPSRTLVLINGKRKNASSLVYINDTPGKGDVGVDMNSIPVNAIKRVEVLRDGASAQYGSDAIAGVINIVLQDQTEQTHINTFSSITGEGDGFQLGANFDTGFKIGDMGYFNLSSGYVNQQETNRAGTPGKDVLFGQPASNPWIKENPDLGMRVGLPNMTTANVYYNTAIEVDDLSEIYSFGGLVYRSGLSYALYRTPYWVPDPYNLLHDPGTKYEGFQPTFETNIFDNEFTAGYRSQKNGWKYDLSYTYGSNSVDYTIGNTLNPSLKAQSPTEFNAGGYRFNNNIINLDISKLLFDKLFLNIGSEFRIENFVAVEGEEASYIGGGAQSFPGLQPQNAVDAKRTNIGAYLDLGYDITNNLFVGGAIRYENYSDFGNNISYKFNARLKTSDNKYSLRGAVSTGFRAPSLHQIYLSNVQTLISGGTISNQGTFNNNSPVLRQLGVDKLKEEDAMNFTIGAAARPINNLFISVDLYQINIDDRIVYSSSITSNDTTSTVGKILKANDITSLKFFINAVDTKTQGIDIVANYKYRRWGFNLAANFAKQEIDGKIKTPDVLAKDGIDIFDRKEQSRLVSARPNTKVVLGLSYDFNPVKVGLNSTYFGEVTWKHVNNGLNGVDLGNGPLPTDDAAYDQTFGAKVIFDLNLRYAITPQIAFSFMINNLLDTYPDKIDTKGDFVTNLGGRFVYPWEVNQFGFNGRVFLATLNFTL